MRITVNKNAVKVTGISNEAQLEMVQDAAEAADAVYENADFGSAVVVTTNLDAFVQEMEGQ
jgi:hypothetical protein